MWMIQNGTPYAVERNWTRDKDGRHHWIVCVRATFDIGLDGSLHLADEQPPPALAPEYAGEPGRSSLRWDSDLLHIAPCTDVIVEANAHAPGSQPAEMVPVSLRVGSVDKQLLVHGTRVFYQGPTGLALSAAQPFVSKPIRYEFAYGGVDVTDPDVTKQGMDGRNPIGKGFALDPARLVDTEAPALEFPGRDQAEAGPAGFGPIDAAWLPRRALAGSYGPAWERDKKPLLPDDFDPFYGASAPVDQQVRQYLRGGESVELRGMRAEGALRFDLPKIYLTYSTYIAGQRQEHRGKLATVLLLPELRQVALVWQSTLLVGAKHCDYLDRTVVAEKAYLT